jgi:alpha-galactosidase
LFNRSENATSVTLNCDEAALSGKWIARDLWLHKNLGEFDTRLTLQVPAHGAVLLRLTPAAK